MTRMIATPSCGVPVAKASPAATQSNSAKNCVNSAPNSRSNLVPGGFGSSLRP